MFFDQASVPYLALPRDLPSRKMTTLSYSLVILRVKKREKGKVARTMRKEQSSRRRERPSSAGSGSGGRLAMATNPPSDWMYPDDSQ